MLSTGFKSYRKRGPVILVFGEINFLCRPEGCCYDKNKVSQFTTEVEKQKTKKTSPHLIKHERNKFTIVKRRGGSQRSLPLPDLSRKIEGPLLAG